MSEEERATRLEMKDKELEDYKAGHEVVKEKRGNHSNDWRSNTEKGTAKLEADKEANAAFWTDQEARLEKFKETLVPEE